MTMPAPADRVVKRISAQQWFARYDLSNLMQAAHAETRDRAPRQMPAPADRTAVRA